MQKPFLNPAQFRRLVSLNRKLAGVLGFDTVPKRDPRTGAFTASATLDPKSVRAAWSIPRRQSTVSNPVREAFKMQLLAALRTPRK
jgi:hypothetical protein